MANRISSMPLAMILRKFYCHQCGERLVKSPRTRTVGRGDPDYKKYNKMHHMHLIGDIEVTEYGFLCPSCDKTLAFDEQRLIEKIQKYAGRHTLSQGEISHHTEKAKAALARNQRITKLIATGLSIILAAIALYLWLRSGDHSFTLYF